VDTLTSDIASTTANAFTLTNGTRFAAASMLPYAAGYYTIQVDNEQMLVTGLAFGNYSALGGSIYRGGTGYSVGDLLTVTGGTGTPTTLTATAVSAGVITGSKSRRLGPTRPLRMEALLV
jgi:hypothetical protein